MTTDEIVRALRCGEDANGTPRPEPSDGEIVCYDPLKLAAADLIESLTAENVVLPGGEASAIESLRKEIEWKDMVIALAQRKQTEAEAERDAAIADLKITAGCASCEYKCYSRSTCCDCTKKQNCKCMSCHLGRVNWQWRGLPEAPEEGEKA